MRYLLLFILLLLLTGCNLDLNSILPPNEIEIVHTIENYDVSLVDKAMLKYHGTPEDDLKDIYLFWRGEALYIEECPSNMFIQDALNQVIAIQDKYGFVRGQYADFKSELSQIYKPEDVSLTVGDKREELVLFFNSLAEAAKRTLLEKKE